MRLRNSSVYLWGEERTADLDHALKAASAQIHCLFQAPLGGRDEEPDFLDLNDLKAE